MTKHPIGRNAKCPCGSGKKYKNCCLKKNSEFFEDEHGTVRSVPISDELNGPLGTHMDDLANELGRDLEPEDPLFPNQYLEHNEHEIVQGMKAAGVDPALIYAFEQTGLLVSEENQDLISEQDLAEWQSAIDEYRDRHGQFGVKYPIGTVAWYGPDDKVTTKIVAGVIRSADSEAILERFVGTGIADDEKVKGEIKAFFAKHHVTQIVASDRNMGCPHEEGEDFPIGEDCPFCPFWKGKQGSATNYPEDEEPTLEEQAAVTQMLESMDPSTASEIADLARQCESADELANRILVGSCPSCDSENTGDCENDPEIDDPCIGRCADCHQLWCCDCGETFASTKDAANHDCPVWESMLDELDEPFEP